MNMSEDTKFRGGFYRCEFCGSHILWERPEPMATREIDIEIKYGVLRFCSEGCKEDYLRQQERKKSIILPPTQ